MARHSLSTGFGIADEIVVRMGPEINLSMRSRRKRLAHCY
jgi:hypothetical protein